MDIMKVGPLASGIEYYAPLEREREKDSLGGDLCPPRGEKASFCSRER